MACKNKWWPHNWFCLKGLYWIFVVIFYIILALSLYQIISAIYYIFATWNNPMINTTSESINLLFLVISDCFYMLVPLTVAAILKALRKIKKAVAPCCCEAHKEEVVVVSSEEK